jgi:hypothetical protein
MSSSYVYFLICPFHLKTFGPCGLGTFLRQPLLSNRVVYRKATYESFRFPLA